jgi:hypothetical protein
MGAGCGVIGRTTADALLAVALAVALHLHCLAAA